MAGVPFSDMTQRSSLGAAQQPTVDAWTPQHARVLRAWQGRLGQRPWSRALTLGPGSPASG